MQFKDLLDVLESDEQLFVTVVNEWGGEAHKGTVEHFIEEERLSNLRVDRVYTRIIPDDEHFDACANRVSFSTEIDVTLFDEEHEIIFPED